MTSPGTKATGGTLDTTKELSADEKNMVPKAGGILIYLGQDVPQIQFAAKAVMQDAAKPTGVTVARLKRVGRHLLGHRITEWHYVEHNLPGEVITEGDSDRAGSEDARSSQCCV